MKKIFLVLCILLTINIFIYKSDTNALEYNKITVDIKVFLYEIYR